MRLRKWRSNSTHASQTVTNGKTYSTLETDERMRLRPTATPNWRVRQLSTYPADFWGARTPMRWQRDDAGVVFATVKGPGGRAYLPVKIAQYALSQWNQYVATANEVCKEAFVQQARRLLDHERAANLETSAVHITNGSGSYAQTLGTSISTFLRAYALTGEASYLEAAQQAVQILARDILDGGVSAPVGDDGICFEDSPSYPLAHNITGCLAALFALHEYAALTKDARVAALIGQGERGLHSLLEGADTGYWSRRDLLPGILANRAEHIVHSDLLACTARLSGCSECAARAERWTGYQRRTGSRIRYWVVSRLNQHVCGVLRRLRSGRAHTGGVTSGPVLVSVPITAFPLPGGMRSVLAGVASVMRGTWNMEYLTHQLGTDHHDLTIHRFGARIASQWYMPTVWLYCLAGWHRLTALIRHGHRYRLILPQDGVFTGAFAALTGKLAGVRVVCMDHGNVTLPYSPAYRQERIRAARAHRWPLRWVLRIGLVGYVASLRLMTRFATRCTDHFLVAGEEVETVYRERFSVPMWRITRYPYVVDNARFTPPSASAKCALRHEAGIADDGIVLTMINRLAPEKGLDIAMRGIGQAVAALPDHLRARVRIIIAGDGPLRQQVEADKVKYSLADTCSLFGDATPADVVHLLALSDIFLYTGTRGTNYSMAILEAMASSCAVIATVEPRSNAHLLAEGRGITIPVGDADAVSQALAQLITDLELRERMGRDARLYIAEHHSGEALRRCLLRATYWPGWSGYKGSEREIHGAYSGIVTAGGEPVSLESS